MLGFNSSASHDGRVHSPTSTVSTPLTPAFSSDSRSHAGSSHAGSAMFDMGGGVGVGWEASGRGEHFLLKGGGMGGSPGPGGSRFNQYSPRPQRHQRRLSQQQQRRAQQELLGPDEYNAPAMRPDEQRAFDTARDAGLNDHGCRLIWVHAITNAAANGWSCDSEDYPTTGGATCGVPDRVPWEYLSNSLRDHLCQKLTIPSSRGQIVDHGPYSWLMDSSMGLGGGGSYGAINTPTLRGMNEEEMSFVRERLLRIQEQIWHASAGMRGSGRTERRPSAGMGMRADGVNLGENGMDHNMVAIEAFADFSKWWAPLMTTLCRLRNDWSSTSPVRVHGFVGRQAASTKLLEKEAGTFLLRFSESVAGALVVSFTEHVSRGFSFLCTLI